MRMTTRLGHRAHVGELRDAVRLQQLDELVERTRRMTDRVDGHDSAPKSSTGAGGAGARSIVCSGRPGARWATAATKRARTAAGSTSPRLPFPIRHAPSFTVADRYRRSRARVSA